MYMQKFVDGGPAQQVTQFQPTFSTAPQGIGSLPYQAPNTPAMESSPTDYNQSPQYSPTQQYGAPATSYSAPAANPMAAGLGSYLKGLEYKAPPPPPPPPAAAPVAPPAAPATGTIAPAKYPDMPQGLTYGGERTWGNDETGFDSEGIFKDASGRSVYYSPAVGGEDPQAASYYYKNEDEDGGYRQEAYRPNKAGGRIRSYAQGGSIPQGIASLGRGQDSMLVHMTPGEVGGLQQLAMAHGGSLTINPQTGLPEAGFLSKMLPTLIGLGLTAVSGGTIPGWMIGAGIGGVTALTSGSLKKGLMAGLGAYGGASLGGSLANMGAEQANALASPELAAAGQTATTTGNAAADSALKFAEANKQAEIEKLVGQAAANPDALMDSNAYRDFLTKQASSTVAPTDIARPNDFVANPYSQQGIGYMQSQGSTGADIAQTAKEYAANASPMPAYSEATQQALARGPVGNAVEGFKQLGSKEGLKTLGGKLGYAGVAGLAAPLLSSAMEPSKFNPPAKTPTQYYKADYRPPKYNELTGNYDPASYGPGSYYTNPTQYAAQGGLMGAYAEGGAMDTYAAGGRLLRGPGDGMSDSIPAVIKGAKPQRAALADGEFVIPADVVSHLGNGSTEAGSKRLYSMMDKVRRARTGNPKQGRQINPDRFMPA